jgi:prepilin-type N-terminal cleavage/methylation domain-containing protein
MIARNRRGFTLLEVIVALAVTGLVAGLAFGAASAGIDTRERLVRVRRQESSAGALREVLHDALRHAEPGVSSEDTTFALGGLGAGEAIRFVTRGVLPPLGTGGRWALTVRASAEGTTLIAVPMDDVSATPVRVVAPTIAGITVRALERAGGTWASTWDRPSSPPVAVAIRFLDGAGHDVVPALVARTRAGGLPEEAP